MDYDQDSLDRMFYDWHPFPGQLDAGQYYLDLSSAKSDITTSSEDADVDSLSIGSPCNPHSAPQSPKHSGRRPTINPGRFKTEMCRPFLENGICRYGNKCQFAHGASELRGVPRHPKYKTEMCRTFHTTGICPYGPRCHFIHSENGHKLQEISEIKKQEITQRAVREMAQLFARQQLVQGRIGKAIAHLQQQLILQNFMIQMKSVRAAQKAAKQLGWSNPRPMSMDSVGDTPPVTPTCSSPPGSPCSAMRPPPGFESNIRVWEPQAVVSSDEMAVGRLPIFSSFTN